MLFYKYSFLIVLFISTLSATAQKDIGIKLSPTAIVIHGGAGTILKENMTDELEEKYLLALDTALSIGEEILNEGKSSIDAVEETIKYLENNPLFNAGVGAVFTNNETNELDASIMYGLDQNAGAVGGVSTIKHPISAARAVMESSVHVMMVGKGAEEFASEQGIEQVDPSYFLVKERLESLRKRKTNERL